MTALFALKRLSYNTYYRLGLSAAFSAVSAFLLWAHMDAVRIMQTDGIPAAVNVARMESRAEMLGAQKEIAELQAALRGASLEERLGAYILPSQPDIDRPLAYLDIVLQKLYTEKLLETIPRVRVGEVDEEVHAVPLLFEARFTREGFSAFLQSMELTGIQTVADAFSGTQIEQLVGLTDDQPAETIGQLEHFLSSDVLAYSMNKTAYEERLLKAFRTGNAKDQVRILLAGSGLPRLQKKAQEMAEHLRDARLWPLRFMQVGNVQISMEDSHWWTVSVTAYALMSAPE